MKQLIIIVLIACSLPAAAQYSFSGFVDKDRWQGDVYLSLIEDYRKLSGIYSEQIVAKTKTDSLGYFEFTGDQLDARQRIYRIHVDNCEAGPEDSNHFAGHCPDSKEVLFLAKNTDTIGFPFSFDRQMFCEMETTNEKSIALMQIDSLKEEMRYAFAEYRSETNRKLNSKKWVRAMLEFGRKLDEPLAELYSYAFISERSSEVFDYYRQDVGKNNFYEELENRLISAYPDAPYTKQYSEELAADRFIFTEHDSGFFSRNLLYTFIAISLLLNVYLLFRLTSAKRKKNSDIRSSLTQQENKILDQLLSDLSNKDIAEANFVSVSTVKTHVNNIYRKLNVQSRDEVKSLFNK